MRPVQRGASPQTEDFADYQDAKPELVARLGLYCSFCERRIPTLLAVEHIRPKSKYPQLAGRWDNFLLACVNCNSTKGDEYVQPAAMLLPDRDNTFAALHYSPDGSVQASPALHDAGLQSLAEATLALTGLHRPAPNTPDAQGQQVALDRQSQRMQVWLMAQIAHDELAEAPDHELLRRSIVRQALAEGFFSVWMTVFADDADMRQRLVTHFPGTQGSGCFDPSDASPISPAPNPDALADGGKF